MTIARACHPPTQESCRPCDPGEWRGAFRAPMRRRQGRWAPPEATGPTFFAFSRPQAGGPLVVKELIGESANQDKGTTGVLNREVQGSNGYPPPDVSAAPISFMSLLARGSSSASDLQTPSIRRNATRGPSSRSG